MFYPIIEDGDAFYFETDPHNKVSVEFSDLTNLFESVFPIFCVDIYRTLNSEHVNDLHGPKTRNTIVKIVKGFFDKYDCALIAFILTSRKIVPKKMTPAVSAGVRLIP